jgi:hypothetical protein
MIKINAYCPHEETNVLSIKELAESANLDYLEAQGLVKALVKLGVAKEAGKRKVEGAKGKPTNLYAIPMCIQLTLYTEAVPKAA